jgi:protein tyrosine phosphatase
MPKQPTPTKITARDVFAIMKKMGFSPDSLIEQTICIAEKNFTPGHKIKQDMRDKIEKLLKDKNKEGKVNVYYDSKEFSLALSVASQKIDDICYVGGKTRSFPFPRFVDSNFTINANLIKGTNFIAAAGPQHPNCVGAFFENTVFHSKTPINRIIALGQTLADGNHYQDFYDYIIKPRRKNQAGNFSFTIQKKKVKGSYSVAMSGQITPKTVIKSTIVVNDNKGRSRELQVTLINLKDNGVIDLKEDKNDILKNTLWQCLLYEGNKLVHCAAGIGRTGHLILTLEILKNYQYIFGENNEKIAADRILAIVERIRENRFCLIQVEDQFTAAIRNAHILYNYGLKMGFVQAKTQEKQPAKIKHSVEDEKGIELQSLLAHGLHKTPIEKIKTGVIIRSEKHTPFRIDPVSFGNNP